MIEKLNYEYGQPMKIQEVTDKINEIIEAVNQIKADDKELINVFRNIGIADFKKYSGV